VLGCGIDVAYPREHARLLDEIARSGAVVSEFPPGESPRRRNFPRRNRIISGLSRAVVVVEAGGNSGSLITANRASDQNRDVWAVPHNLDTEGGGGDGPNGLIRAGARILTRAEDVLEEMPGGIRKKFFRQREERSAILRKQDGEPDVAEGMEEILEALSFHTPRQADQLAERTGLEPGTLLRSLTELELEGLVEKLPGLRFVRRRGY
jgi:DNA processing protein